MSIDIGTPVRAYLINTQKAQTAYHENVSPDMYWRPVTIIAEYKINSIVWHANNRYVKITGNPNNTTTPDLNTTDWQELGAFLVEKVLTPECITTILLSTIDLILPFKTNGQGAVGTNSTAFGDNAIASALATTAIGAGAQAIKLAAVALGAGAVASEENATVVGTEAIASGGFSTAVGRATNASALQSTAIGGAAAASGADSIAFGVAVIAEGTGAIAIGTSANATGNDSTSVGYVSSALAALTTALGRGATASGNASTALGANATASAINSTALGRGATASGNGSLALGVFSMAAGTSSTALGEGAFAFGNAPTALGSLSKATGDNSMALGISSEATGSDSIAVGRGTVASAGDSIAVGRGTVASGSNSTALGNNSTASGIGATALGSLSKASGNASTALGDFSMAAGIGATALGWLSESLGQNSTCLGSRAFCSASENDTLRLGDIFVTALKCKVALTVTSDERDKANIESIEENKAIEFLKSLKPIKYNSDSRLNYLTEKVIEKRTLKSICEETGKEIETIEEIERDSRASDAYDELGNLMYFNKDLKAKNTKCSSIVEIGLSAQEVEKSLDEVFQDKNFGRIVSCTSRCSTTGEPTGVREEYSEKGIAYSNLIPFLIQGFQYQQREIEMLKKEIEELKK